MHVEATTNRIKGRPRGGRPARLSGGQPKQRGISVSNHPQSRPRGPRAPADHRAAARRAEAPGPAARHGHRVRLPHARTVEAAGVDLVLVGDSAAMTVLGYSATARAVDEMLVLARGRAPRAAHPAARRGPAVRLLRGLRRAGHHHGQRIVKEAGCEVIKLEGGGRHRSRAPAPSPAPASPSRARRADAPDVHRARRLEGQARTAGAPAGASRRCRAAGGRLLRLVFEAIPAAVAEALCPTSRSP